MSDPTVGPAALTGDASISLPPCPGVGDALTIVNGAHDGDVLVNGMRLGPGESVRLVAEAEIERFPILGFELVRGVWHVR